MRRREFIAGIGSAAAWPVAAGAQQPPMPVVGLLRFQPLDSMRDPMAAFHRGLADSGYVEGRNVAIESRSAEGQADRLPALAADLVRRQVAVIATPDGTAATFAARAATQTIPIVFGTGGDPVDLGLVGNLARPNGNLTGATLLSTEVAAKRLEVMHEVLPMVGTMAVLYNPRNQIGVVEINELQAAAGILGMSLLVLAASIQSEIEPALAAYASGMAGAFLITGDALFIAERDRIVTYAERHRVPAIYSFREDAEAGGLVSYGTSIADFFRLIGVYTGRILKGEKPADLPVQQATKIELVINLKTARALGITFPLPLLGRADEVIE
jgi:putative tryptophan/tyrosine transport system substrate-binding protein